MPIADWFRRRSRGQRADIDLAELEAALAQVAPRFAGAAILPLLLRARLADALRDVGIEPLAPEQFDAATAPLDEEAWRRLALAISALDVEAMRRRLAHWLDGKNAGAQVKLAFIDLARETPLLTFELLRESSLRIEEFARQLLARLGATIAGETVEQSRARLERLDYAGLLAEAERAKVSAADRMEYLRKLQEEQDARRPRRGKW